MGTRIATATTIRRGVERPRRWVTTGGVEHGGYRFVLPR